MLKLYSKKFRKDAEGAVTVDWVVLTAAVVGLAVVAYVGIKSNTTALAENTSTVIASEIGN